MGLLMERTATISRQYRWPTSGIGVEMLDLCGHIEVALGPKKEAVAGPSSPAHQADASVKCRLGRPSSETKVAAAPLGVESSGDGDRLDQSRLAASVLADKKG